MGTIHGPLLPRRTLLNSYGGPLGGMPHQFRLIGENFSLKAPPVGLQILWDKLACFR